MCGAETPMLKVRLDKEDEYLLEKYSWYNDHGYARASVGNDRHEYLHRVIMDFPKGSVDHINGDSLDNRRCNLRVCSQSQNMANQGLSKANKTGFKGVFWRKERNKFVAYITIRRKRKHLGYFKEAIEAARAYDNAAKEAWGEYSILNFGNTNVRS